MSPTTINDLQFLFFEDSRAIRDILFLTTLFRKLDLNQASFDNHPSTHPSTHKTVRMPSPQAIYDSTSVFAERVQFLTSFNPDFHLDDSYLDVHHPEHVPSLFHRRRAQLAIIGENTPLKMDPLDWNYLYRPNRPFHFITNRKLRGSIPKIPPRPWLERQRKDAQQTDYLREQMAFFAAAPIPIPEEDISAIDESPCAGPLKVWCLLVWAMLVTIGGLLLVALSIVPLAMKRVGAGASRRYRMAGGFPWEALCIALATSQLVRFLPGMEGKVEVVQEVWKADPPLYVLMIQNPNQWSKFFLLLRERGLELMLTLGS